MLTVTPVVVVTSIGGRVVEVPVVVVGAVVVVLVLVVVSSGVQSPLASLACLFASAFASFSVLPTPVNSSCCSWPLPSSPTQTEVVYVNSSGGAGWLGVGVGVSAFGGAGWLGVGVGVSAFGVSGAGAA